MDFFTGSYTRLGGAGISLCRLQGDTLSLLYSAAGLEDPTYVILSEGQTMLYAVSTSRVEDQPGGCAAAYRITESGLSLRSLRSTGGDVPCHLSLSPDGRFLAAANYLGGSLAVFAVEGEEIGPRLQLVAHRGSGPDPTRQEKAHPHQVVFQPGTGLIFCVDLGMDAVMCYEQDAKTGLLDLRERLPVAAGMGPRHLVFNAAGDVFYLACELGNALCVFRRIKGRWKCAQTLSTLPASWQGESACAAILLLGGQVMVSNRGHDSLAVFDILSGGLLAPRGIYPTLGKNPRDFATLPDGRILASHQDGGGLRLFSLGSEGLIPLGAPLDLPGVVCLCPKG